MYVHLYLKEPENREKTDGIQERRMDRNKTKNESGSEWEEERKDEEKLELEQKDTGARTNGQGHWSELSGLRQQVGEDKNRRVQGRI